MQPPRTRAFAIVTVAYAVALAAAVAASYPVSAGHPLLKAALGTVVGTLVVFAFSRGCDNTSIYDPYWSVGPLAIAVYLFSGPGSGSARSVVVLLLISAWSWRLTLNWARGWRGLKHEDWRYVDMRRLTGSAYWWASAFGLHLFPTAIVFLGLLPTHAAFTSDARLNALDGAAAAVAVFGICFETVADEQMWRFRSRPSASVCAVGVWRYTRHPNYFGEICFWVGLWLFGLAAGGPWWTALGPLAMVGLFVLASIPLMERHLAARRAGWPEHVQRTSMLIPWPPKAGD
jgi:steroid 5-alpha reductase family enzyme